MVAYLEPLFSIYDVEGAHFSEVRVANRPVHDVSTVPKVFPTSVNELVLELAAHRAFISSIHNLGRRTIRWLVLCVGQIVHDENTDTTQQVFIDRIDPCELICVCISLLSQAEVVGYRFKEWRAIDSKLCAVVSYGERDWTVRKDVFSIVSI